MDDDFDLTAQYSQMSIEELEQLKVTAALPNIAIRVLNNTIVDKKIESYRSLSLEELEGIKTGHSLVDMRVRSLIDDLINTKKGEILKNKSKISEDTTLVETLIDKYEGDYKSALNSIETDVKKLVENGKEMQALVSFSESVNKVVEVHDSLSSFYNIIHSNQSVLKHFGSERIRQVGFELVSLYDQLKDNVETTEVEIEKFVVTELSKFGYKTSHWWIKERILVEVEYMLDVLRILIEPEFIPLETNNVSSEEKPDRYIPSAIKLAVWRRDGGKCVECGSKIKLEYDHIIPVSKGGSNTERNIQLLCEKCNRHKSANIQ